MLKKRSRSLEKDQQQQMGHLTTMSDSGTTVTESHFNSENHKSNSLFSVPGLFVGLSPKVLDSDSVRSPTSPLDFRVFSNLGNPSFRSSKSSINGQQQQQQKSWDTSKVGLSIIDSLDDDDDKKLSGEVLKSESKNILFGPKMRIKAPYNNQTNNIHSLEAPKSLPKNYAIFPFTQIKSPLQKGNSDVVFEIGETPLEPEPFGKIRSRSLDSCRPFSALAGLAVRSPPNLSSGSYGLVSSPPQLIGGNPSPNNFSPVKRDSMSVSLGSANGFVDILSASEIELSEDYTRVISHGPNPKTTHIYSDCILECHTDDLTNFGKTEVKETGIDGVATSITTTFPPVDFLSFCYSCNKKLDGKDIYIYRGEKAFCSKDCRSQEIMNDEEMEKTINKSCENSPKSDKYEEEEDVFETSGIFVAT